MSNYWQLILKWLKKLIAKWNFLNTLLRNLYAFAQALEPAMRIKIVLLQTLQLFGYIIFLIGSLAIVPFINYAIKREESLQSPWMQRLYDLITIYTPFNFVLALAALSITLLLISRLAQVGADYAKLRLDMSLKLYYQSNLFYYYIHQNVLSYKSKNVTDILHDVNSRLPQVLNKFINPFLQLIQTSLFLLVGLGALFLTDPWLVIFAIAPITLFLITSFYVTRIRLTKWTKVVDHESLKRQSRMLESLLAREYIQILGKEKVFAGAFKDALHKSQLANLKIAIVSMLFSPMAEILTFSTLIGVVSYTLLAFSDQDLTRVTFFLVIIYRILPKANSLFGIYAGLKQGMVYFDNTADQLLPALKQQTSYEQRKPNPLPFHKRIKFEKVSCRYDNKDESPQILRNINLTIPHGAKIGILGESGCGKTTLLRILIGMLRPQQGKIFIDDRQLTPRLTRAWQDNIGYVSQNLMLLRLSVIENISLSSEGEPVDEERIRKVLAISESTEFVEALPQGIHTILEGTDTKLSGGQKQRLIIARSLYTSPNVLVLDEATSSLDRKTEKKIMHNIYQAMPNSTIIVVTHRIEAIKDSDQLIMLKEGSIAARGTYKKLLKNKDFAALAK